LAAIFACDAYDSDLRRNQGFGRRRRRIRRYRRNTVEPKYVVPMNGKKFRRELAEDSEEFEVADSEDEFSEEDLNDFLNKASDEDSEEELADRIRRSRDTEEVAIQRKKSRYRGSLMIDFKGRPSRYRGRKSSRAVCCKKPTLRGRQLMEDSDAEEEEVGRREGEEEEQVSWLFSRRRRRKSWREVGRSEGEEEEQVSWLFSRRRTNFKQLYRRDGEEEEQVSWLFQRRRTTFRRRSTQTRELQTAFSRAVCCKKPTLRGRQLMEDSDAEEEEVGRRRKGPQCMPCKKPTLRGRQLMEDSDAEEEEVGRRDGEEEEQVSWLFSRRRSRRRGRVYIPSGIPRWKEGASHKRRRRRRSILRGRQLMEETSEDSEKRRQLDFNGRRRAKYCYRYSPTKRVYWRGSASRVTWEQKKERC